MMWNPWHGCHKVSEGCKNCYMFYFDQERGVDSNHVFKTNSFLMPIKKDRHGKYKVQGGELQTCLTSDFFLEEADQWRNEVWQMIKMRSDVTFVLFTKRVERIEKCLPSDWGSGYENVVFNLTCENQRRADERLPIFLNLNIGHRCVLVSPCLERVNLREYLKSGKIESVYLSGENYKNARICDYDWVKDLAMQCKEFNTSFFFFHTGSLFRKDGKIYKIPYSQGKIQAEKAGLDYQKVD